MEKLWYRPVNDAAGMPLQWGFAMVLNEGGYVAGNALLCYVRWRSPFHVGKDAVV